MKNTAEEVVIPRALAHKVKSILMALENAWANDEAKFNEVKRVSVDFIGAEKYLSTPCNHEDSAWADSLIPIHNQADRH